MGSKVRGPCNIMTSIHILALSLILLCTSCKSSPFFDEKPALTSESEEPKTFMRKVLDNGDIYIGNLENGKPNGPGTYWYADGNIYVGNFLDGEANGQGIWKSNYGAIYVGEFKHDKSGGHGTYISEDGEVYVGNSEGNMSQ